MRRKRLIDYHEEVLIEHWGLASTIDPYTNNTWQGLRILNSTTDTISFLSYSFFFVHFLNVFICCLSSIDSQTYIPHGARAKMNSMT